jgi:hypothetical protein
MTQARDITVVITSCNRHDLLARTLTSFFANETGERIARILVAEDGDADPGETCRRFGVDYFMTGSRVGQVALIDEAYARVTTPYIFHLEDDWEFTRYGFMEKSRALLEAEPRIILVQLRPWNILEQLTYIAPDQSFAHVSSDDPIWHGFSFQPALRRISDYRLLGSFAGQTLTLGVVPLVPSAALPYEAQASDFYYRRGYFAAILDRAGYVRHIGDEKHVFSAEDTRSLPRNVPPGTPCPCGSGRTFADCHGKGGRF